MPLSPTTQRLFSNLDPDLLRAEVTAEIVLHEFGNRDAAARYCDRIADRNGQHANEYRTAARVLRFEQ